MPRIRRVILVIIGMLLLGIVAACVSSGVEEPVPQPQVVMVRCSGSFEVMASDNSENAPAVTATSCAQALADLLNAGFEIQDVQPAIGGDEMHYTLIQ